MRIPVLMTALALASGCASTPATSPTSAAATPSMAHTVSASTTASSPSAGKTVVASTARKSPLGYRVAKKNGQTYYCRDEKPIGSNIPHTVCLTPDEYAQVQEQAEVQRQDVRRHSAVCGSVAGVCGGG